MAKGIEHVIVAFMSNLTAIDTTLTDWAKVSFGSGATIVDLKRLSGGASQETWSFDLSVNTQITEMILRRAPARSAGSTQSEAIGLSKEAGILNALSGQDVAVPTVIHLFEDHPQLGNGIVMNRIHGETLAKKILHSPELESARNRLTSDSATALAAIHQVTLSDLPELPVSNGSDQLTRYEAVFRDYGQSRPVFELAIRWLKDNQPAPLPNQLIHGDFRLGNLMVDSNGLASVLDWELAHIGDPREDLAWLCVNSWRFGQSSHRVGGFGHLDELLSSYNASANTQITEAEIDWWEMLGSFKWGVMCMTMYEAFRTGADPSVERAAIGRRVSETEIDMLNLIEGGKDHA